MSDNEKPTFTGVRAASTVPGAPVSDIEQRWIIGTAENWTPISSGQTLVVGRSEIPWRP